MSLRRRAQPDRDQRGGHVHRPARSPSATSTARASFVAQAGTVGLYGTFAIDGAGAWTYTASSAHNEFAAGSTYTDTFSVASSDGTLTSVTVNIAGSNDAAVLSADVRNLTETNSRRHLQLRHAHRSATSTIPPASWRRPAPSASTAPSPSTAPAPGPTPPAPPTTSSRPAAPTPTPSRSPVADGTLTSVTINIAGSNDAAVLSADVRNLTETNSAAVDFQLRHAHHHRSRQRGDASWRRPAPWAATAPSPSPAPGPGPTPQAPPTTSSSAGSDLYRHLRGRQRRRHADLGDDQHRRQQRRRRAVRRSCAT